MKLIDSDVKKVFYNKKQEDFILNSAKTKVLVGGRAWGKTYTIGSNHSIKAPYLAKAKVGLISLTMRQLKNNVVPSMMRAIQDNGYLEHKEYRPGHFVKFKKPPKQWPTPFEQPEDYETVITFCNGYTIQLVSIANGHNADIIRGFNFDGLDIDEAGFGLDKKLFDSAIMPTVRGNQHKFKDNPFHQQICMYTSMPWTTQGQWLLDFEQGAKEYPEKLAFMRATSWDNIDVIGKDVVERWKRDMHPLEYSVEIMCETPHTIPNNYYEAYDDNIHCYVNSLYSHFEEYQYDKPVLASFDFSPRFICCVLGQYVDNTLNLTSEQYVKRGKIIDHLIYDIDKYYNEYEGIREIHIYGDPSGWVRKENSTESYFQLIKRLFNEKGWRVKIKAPHAYPTHDLRHRTINKLLEESDPHSDKIRINSRECPYLSSNLNRTPIKSDFKKDKSSEKDESLAQEKATHLSDCFDYLILPICTGSVSRSRNNHSMKAGVN